MKAKKQIFAWILVVAMIISMLGNTSVAFAATGDEIQSTSILENLSFAPMSGSNVESLVLTQADTGKTGFDPDVTNYIINTPDTATNLYVKGSATSGTTVKVSYNRTNNEALNTVTVSLTSTSGTNLPYVQLAGSKENRELTVVATNGSESKTYHFQTKIASRTLNALSVKNDGKEIKLSSNFSNKVRSYETNLLDSVKEVELSATAYKSAYKVLVDDVEMTGSSVKVDLGDEAKKVIKVKVQYDGDSEDVENVYEITINRAAPVRADFKITPEDAHVQVVDADGEDIPAVDGKYELIPGNTYNYFVTKSGYVGKSGELKLSEDTTTEVALEESKENTSIDTTIDSYWKNFRNDENNMAVVDVKTPKDTKTTELKWAKKLGSGWGNAPSVQIIVDKKVITIAGTKIYKLNPDTGDIEQEGQLVGSTNYGYTPPTYADGVIYCPLQNGTIQAVNAKTLESLWVYKDKLGGQSLSAITYKDGYVYTGFWNAENKAANFVCLSATDEDPDNTTEEKLPTWTYKQMGGFYWAGSVAIGDAIIVGTDDGVSGNLGTSHLLSFDAKTGKVISDLKLKGDQRSCIAYDTETGRIFGTTKAGYLFSADVNKETGELSDLKTKWYGKSGDSETATMSTSTPVVYKGVAYIGYTASGNFGGSGYCLIAADANTLEENYRVPLIGYPQGSALISTAYEQEDGNVYIYMTYNAQPGGITLIKAKPDAKSASDVTVEEIYDAKGYEQYCITSLICDAQGTIYYKNDSGNILAVAKNEAVIDNITVTGGDPVVNEEFKSNVKDYDVAVNSGTEFVTLTIDKKDNQTVTVDGETLTGKTVDVPLVNGKATVKIKATCNGDSRTYTFSIRERSSDTSLSYLEINETNSHSSFITPKKINNSYIAKGLSTSRTFTNVWTDCKDKNATVKIYPVVGISTRGATSNGNIAITATLSSYNRYALYWEDTANREGVVRVEVTAEDTNVVKNYYVFLTAKTYSADGYYKYDKEQLEKAYSDFCDYLKEDDILPDELKTQIQALKVKVSAIQAFEAQKEDAIKELTPKDGVYREEQQKEVDIILKDVKRQLQNISEAEDLETVVNRAKLDISRIKTDAQLTEEESKQTLEISKKSITLMNDQTYQLSAKATSNDESLKCAWTSSDESIATVDETGKVTAVKAGVASISVTYGELEEVCVVTVKYEEIPKSITITDKDGKLTEGNASTQNFPSYFYTKPIEKEDTVQLSATNEEGKATTVIWSTSNGNIKISKDGLLTIPANVTQNVYSKITAKSIHDNSVVAEYPVFVLPQIKIGSNYENKTLKLPENGIENRNAEYICLDVQTYDTYGLTKWSVEDDSIVSIDASGRNVCYVYPKKAGTTTVTVTDVAHPENTATTTVTVTGIKVTDANGKSGEGFANVGDTLTLTAHTEDTVTWTSSDEKVATVDNGTVKALSKGEAVITATTENAKCSYTLTVGESGKVYLDLFYTTDYSNLYTDEACTNNLSTQSVYTKPSATWTSVVHIFPTTTTEDTTLYAKAGNSNLPLKFGTNFDTTKVKAQLIQDEQVTELKTDTTNNVTVKTGTNKFTIRVVSLTDEKNYTDYNFTVIREASSTATLKSVTVKPYERQLNTTKKFYSVLAKRSVTEGTLFRAEEDGTVTSTTGFNVNWKNYCAFLYSDAKEAAITLAATDTATGHIAYSTDEGETFTEGTGTITTNGIAFNKNDIATVLVKVVSDKEYAAAKKENTDPFANANTYTFWIQKMLADFDSSTTIESLSFDKNCQECSPNYVKGAVMAAALVAHDSDTATVTFKVDEKVDVYKASVSDSNKLTAKSVENGMATYELEIATPLQAQGGQITQKLVLSNQDEDGNRIDQDYTVYLFKIGTTHGVLKGTPDKIVDYMCLASQYTSGGNTGWGIYGIFPEKINMGAGNWYTCISLGNFGGYMTFYYDKPITDDENNPYGVDFTVFGNSNGGASFAEPGNVLVSEDGKKWYTLAGSEHYDASTRWNYEVTYSNNAGLADYKDNDGNSGEVTKNNAFGAMKYPTKNCYPLFDWKDGNENEITVSGTRLYGSTGKKGDGVEFGGNGAMPAFGYVDVHKNSSTVAGTGEDVNLLTTPVGNPYVANYDGYGDGFDLKWAVDENGNPVDVSNMKFHYVKVQTASFINGGAIGEKSTEVSAMVRTTPEKESVGNTKAPKSITVDGKEITLSEDKNIYYASVTDDSNYTVEVTPESEDTNVYINNERTLTRKYDALPDKGIVRIIVQDGKKNPVIYYIHVIKASESSAEAVVAALDSLGKVTLDKEAQVKEIRKMYDALSKEEQEKVSNADVLTKAENSLVILETEAKIADAQDEKSYEEAKAAFDALTDEQKAQLKDAGAFEAAYVSNRIEQIGEVSLENKEAVEEARKAYDALSKADKKKVTNYQTLVNAELVLENLAMKKDFEEKDKANKTELEKVRFATADVTLSTSSYTYNGKARTPQVTVIVEGKTLVKDTDYTVTYKNNTNVGNASVIITGKGTYEGAKALTKSFVIKAKKISTYTLSKTSYTYNGKAKKPGVVVKSADKVLKKNTDYTVTYKNNKNVGKASVVIKGKGNYSGTKTLTFKINPKSTSLKTLKAGKKQMTVTWKKASVKVTGYQVMYATNKSFTKGKKQITVTGTSKTTQTIKKLSAKKRYYAKVRTYQTVDGKNYYSSWSKVKFVTTK